MSVRIPSTCPTDPWGRLLCYFLWSATHLLWVCVDCGGERTMAEAQEAGKCPADK